MPVVNELIERANVALDGVTLGPWIAEAQGVYCDGGHRLVAHLKAHEWRRSWPQLERDRDFIASSRQLVPELIAALSEAIARAERAEAALADVAKDSGCCDVCKCHMRATRKARALLSAREAT